MENKKLNFWDCMGFCIGQIVGSGVFVLTAIVIGLTGHGAPYGYFLAAIISLISLIPMATLSSSMPATGGSYVYAKKLLGPRIAFVFLLMFILQQVLVSTFAIGFASYRKPDWFKDFCKSSEGHGIFTADFSVCLHRIRSSEG